MSSLADRIKIARMTAGSEGDISPGPDISLSIQFILNCGGEVAGSCHGGSASGAFEFIKEVGYVPYETCMPYLACSSESVEGFCPHVSTECDPMSEYGAYHNNVEAVMTEIYARGPVTAGIAGLHLHNYTGGIIRDKEEWRNLHITHEVEIVGWGMEKETKIRYWIVRNSHGEYWGELSFFRIQMGTNLLGIESHNTWATPGNKSILIEESSSDVYGRRALLNSSQ
eukprot:scaffold5530_cov283-Chaetoceros_neogracile.AAC.22